ncbi:replicative DNA helicase, partial [candidate division KSB1 bacterium]
MAVSKKSVTTEPSGQNDAMATSERLPPQAIEAEMSVLGAMLIEQDAVSKAIELLDESCFYKEAHRKIYRACVDLYDRNEAVDLVTVSAELKKRKQLDEVGGSFYLTELAESVPSAANVDYHAKIVLEKSLLRKLITTATNIISESYSAEGDVFSIIDRAEQTIFNLSERRLRRGFVPIENILHETFEEIEKAHNRKEGVTGIPSGFDELDALTAGFHNSELIIVAGRPSMGKTAFSLNIARNVAVDYNIPVGIFSLEMANYQLAMRMLCSEARVNSHLLRTGRLPESEFPKLSIAVGNLAEAPIYIDDSPALAILELRAKARRLKAEKNIGLLIVDYMQLIQGPKNVENRQQEISMISRSLKALAKELDVPVIALSQLSRAVET